MIRRILAMGMCMAMLLTGCGSAGEERDDGSLSVNGRSPGAASGGAAEINDLVESAITFEKNLDDYMPKKKVYNFYLTYKIVHAWWDAVAMGIEDAADQFEHKGVIINYEYLAPDAVDADDQIKRIRDAAATGRYDVIGVDVADSAKVAPVIDEVMAKGQKVITFSSSDTAQKENCSRIAYVGNTHNKDDGAKLAEALCENIDYKGKVGIIVGDPGAPCHEERLEGALEVLKKYPDIELVGVDYDRESDKRAEQITDRYIGANPDLKGMICCNMVNPVGAVHAVKKRGLDGQVTIVGMDHDERALRYLREGDIYCLGVQDCYSIGFDTMQVAVKVADGLLPGEMYEKLTAEKTTMIYKKDAADMLYKLYGEE